MAAVIQTNMIVLTQEPVLQEIDLVTAAGFRHAKQIHAHILTVKTAIIRMVGIM